VAKDPINLIRQNLKYRSKMDPYAFKDLNTRVQMFAISAPFVLIGILAASYGIYSHIKDYIRPRLQRYEVRILLMIPVYIILTWLPLYYADAIRYYRMCRDFFQGFFVGSFFQLVVEYLGGQDATLEMMSKKQPIPQGKRCWCLWQVDPLDFSEPDKIYLKLKRGAMQFTVIMPIIAIVTMILDLKAVYANGEFNPSESYVWLQLIRLVSAIWAMLSLRKFLNIMDPELEFLHVQARQKFRCIQGVILGLLVQGILISILFAAFGWSTDQNEYTAEDFQNFISVIEMAFVSFAHCIYFSHEEFHKNAPEDSDNIQMNQDGKAPINQALTDSFIPVDYFQELIYVFSKTPKHELKKYRSYGTLLDKSMKGVEEADDGEPVVNTGKNDLEANNH